MKDKEINSVTLALKCIMASTTNCLVFFNLKKSKELKNKKLARQRYCQSICLFFGCIAPIIEDQSENELVSFIQTVTHLFNSSMKKIHGDLFYELDLEPNSEGGFSNLNAEIGRWFFDNSSNPNVASSSHPVISAKVVGHTSGQNVYPKNTMLGRPSSISGPTDAPS